jgi:hypothetical protein
MSLRSLDSSPVREQLQHSPRISPVREQSEHSPRISPRISPVREKSEHSPRISPRISPVREYSLSKNFSLRSSDDIIWTSPIKKLLINWKQQININEKQHLLKADKTKKINLVLETIDTLGNTSVFTILLTVVSQQIISISLLYIALIMESFVLTCSGILGWYEPGILSQRHYTDAKEYNALAKLIDSTLALEPDDNPKEFVALVRKRFEVISENAADLPFDDKVHHLELQIYENPDDARGETSSSSSESSSENNLEIPLKFSNGGEHKFAKDLTKIKSEDDYIDYQWKRFSENMEV